MEKENVKKNNFSNEPTPENFKVSRVQELKQLYSDEVSGRKRYDKTSSYKSKTYSNAKEVRDALDKAATNRETIVETSKQLYSTNPIYASVINYLSNMYS